MKSKITDLAKPMDFSRKVQLNTGKGLTEQAHKRETDMNYILRDYYKTGLIKHAAKNQGRYDDISPVDFREAMEVVANSKSMFEELPANMRKQFDNQPDKFLEFVQNPDNKDQMQKMGILKGNDGIDISGAPTVAPQPIERAPEPTPEAKPDPA